MCKGIVKPTQVIASGPNIENLDRWKHVGASVTDDNSEAAMKSDIIFICVKPHMLTTCASQIEANYIPSPKDGEKVFVSVLAGVNLQALEKAFSFISCVKMIRTMPNTPMQVGEGCTVYTPGFNVTTVYLEKIHLIFNSLGIAQQVPEKMIDAVSGLAGCGPAYVNIKIS